MKILFVWTDVDSPVDTPLYNPGLGELSAYLKLHGHETALHYVKGQLDRAAFRTALHRERPDLVGFSIVTNQWGFCSRMAKWAKEEIDIPVICGGFHPSLAPEEVIADPSVDILCVGEGERPLRELMDRLRDGRHILDIPSLWVKSFAGLRRNPVCPLIEDLDSLPFADTEIFDTRTILDTHAGALFLRAGRGCPNACTYCCTPLMSRVQPGKPVRLRSPRRFVDECLHHLRRWEGMEAFFFLDETINLRRKWLIEFCKLFKAEVGMPWRALARADYLDEETTAAMASGGAHMLWLGMEAGSDRIRELLGRRMSREEIARGFALCDGHGIATGSFSMIGLPTETEEEILQTIDLHRRIRPDDYQISIYYPYPKTPLYELCVREGWLSERRSGSYFERSLLDMPQISAERIQTLYLEYAGQAVLTAAAKRPFGWFDFLAHFREAAPSPSADQVRALWLRDDFHQLFFLGLRPGASLLFRVPPIPASTLVVHLAVAPNAFTEAGGGIEFEVRRNGHSLFRHILDPQGNPEDRKILPLQIDLADCGRGSEDAGGEEILFLARPATEANVPTAWAGFGRPYIVEGPNPWEDVWSRQALWKGQPLGVPLGREALAARVKAHV